MPNSSQSFAATPEPHQFDVRLDANTFSKATQRNSDPSVPPVPLFPPDSPGPSVSTPTSPKPSARGQQQLTDIPKYSINSLNGKIRGEALVFIMENFKKSDKRHGATEDRKKLDTVFKNLHLNPRVYRDFKREDVIQKLDWFFHEQRVKDCRILFVCFSSHGEYGTITCSDDLQLDLEHDLYERFSNTNLAMKCPSLINVPKIFIIQGCRGEKYDEGVAMDGPNSEKYEPSYSDFFILYSCPPNYLSLREPRKGSWLIIAFEEQMQSYAQCDEWKDICTRIANHVGEMEGSLAGFDGYPGFPVVKQSLELIIRGPHKKLFFKR